MNENQRDSISKIKSDKALETASNKTKLTIISKITNIIFGLHKIFVWIVKKLYLFVSKYSILIQYSIILIPFSIIAIILIFCVHY